MIASVFGLGKAGLPLAAVMADSGIEVIGVDINKETVDKINSGKAPFAEPLLDELLQKHSGKNLKATTDAADAVKKAAVHIIIVPLLIDEKKRCDFANIDAACQLIAGSMKKGDLVVLETTVPPKTTETRIKALLETSGLKAGKDFFLANSPERIMTGYSIARYREFQKVVGGIDRESTDKAVQFYSQFGKVTPVSNSRTAELTKVSEGLYRDVNIALANELLQICDNYEVDFWELRKAANHQFCNIHEPGNVGGHCIPVYPWFIINDLDMQLIRTARFLNDDMIKYFADKVDAIAEGNGKVGVIGLTYREGVKELAYTRSLPFIKLLQSRGYAVYASDPLLDKKETEKLGVKYLEDINSMKVIVLLNKYPEYASALKGKNVIDIKNALSKCAK